MRIVVAYDMRDYLEPSCEVSHTIIVVERTVNRHAYKKTVKKAVLPHNPIVAKLLCDTTIKMI